MMHRYYAMQMAKREDGSQSLSIYRQSKHGDKLRLETFYFKECTWNLWREDIFAAEYTSLKTFDSFDALIDFMSEEGYEVGVKILVKEAI